MHRRLSPPLTAFLSILTGSVGAFAQDSFSLSGSTSDGVEADSSHEGSGSDASADSSDQSAEVLHQAPLELGLFLGLFMPSKSHNLTSLGYEPFDRPAVELGARAAYFPLQYLGAEVEGALAFGSTETTDTSASFWMARGHLMGQIPSKFITPFVLFGAGYLHGSSDTTGSDTDPALHVGIGAKFALNNSWGLRMDLRDSASQMRGEEQGKLTHHPEFLIGVSLGIGKEPPPVAPIDTDKDTIADNRDLCPQVAGPAPDGCPDTDGDGIFDNKDSCPTVAGPAPTGCPPGDKDKDGFTDDVDKCPDVPGTIEGCPDPDPDKDGILGEADKCPDVPETSNGFEDSDGCPDEVPEAVKKFTGVMEGIQFDVNTDTIRKTSNSTLDSTVAVLNEYPDLRLMISGHTDSDGTAALNQDLSARRAASVKAYLLKKGIAEDRIETRGAGPDEPIADNKTKAGKQKNRRIEFKLIEGATPAPDAAPAPEAGAAPAAPAATPTAAPADSSAAPAATSPAPK